MTATATTVRLFAPSGYPHDRDAMLRGVARLREAACVVDNEACIERVFQRFGGGDAERAADINQLATLDHLPDIALAIRGGYGASRLLDLLDYGALRERLAGQPFALVGHSDITALQLALYTQSGLTTFGGPMLGPDFGAPEPSALTWQHFWRTLSAAQGSASWETDGEGVLSVEGPLWGGNLAMLCSLLGTPYFPQIDGGILFIEDIGEAPFRVERMLYQLHLSGVLGRQRALLLGDFSACRPAPYDNGFDLAEAFAQLARVSRVPILSGMPFGHEADKFTLPFGVPARLQQQGRQVSLQFSGYPQLRRAHQPGLPQAQALGATNS